MRSLPKPIYTARFTFELCADNVRDEDFAERLRSVAPEIEAAEVCYKEQGAKASLFTIIEATTVAGSVTLKEMKTLYKGTLCRKDSKARHIYDAIKIAPPNNICPLCGHRVVSTLDHYLAQSRHPAFAVTPINLVPACAECNKVKLNMQPSRASEQTLHPYFDDTDDEVWLVADLKESIPPALVFSAVPPSIWEGLKQERVVTHFRIFELGSLYSTHAAVELINMRQGLEVIADRGGVDGLRAHMIEQTESRIAAGKNSWRSAMYKALVKSDWFFEVGYKHIT